MLKMKSEMWQQRYKEANLDEETKKEIERIESQYPEMNEMTTYKERKDFLNSMTLLQLREYYKNNNVEPSKYLMQNKPRLVDAILFAKNFSDRCIVQKIAFSDDRYFGGLL